MGSLAAALLLPFFLSGRSAAECLNGGFPVGSECNCPPMWSGNCNEIHCLNGGYFTTESPGRCVCPTGYLGVHCDAVSTFKRPRNAFPTPDTLFNSPESSFNFVMVNLFSTYWGGLVVSQFQTSLNNHFQVANYSSKNFLTNTAAPQTRDDIFNSSNYSFTTTVFPEALPVAFPPGTYSCYPAPFFQSIVDLIRDKNLRETAITILTQHHDDDLEKFKTIIDLATSFDIRINVVFSDDDTFVRCKREEIQILRDLASKTGGIFVFARQFELYDESDPLFDMVLSTHFRYEGITMDYGNTTNISFKMNVPPAKKYYVVALSDDGNSANIEMDASGCNSTSQNAFIDSGSVAKALYLNGTQIFCNVSATSTGGNIRLVAFGSDFSMGQVNVRVYKSYVETQQLDSSNSQPNHGNSLYLSLHYEARSNTQINEVALRAGGGQNEKLLLNSRDQSVFDWISNNTLICNSDKVQWIELTFTAAMFEKRFFPIHCVEQSASGANSNSMIQTEHLDKDATEIDDSVAATEKPKKSLILAYSDTTTFSEYNSFVLNSASTPQYAPYNNWGGIRFDLQDKTKVQFFNDSDYESFKTDVYIKYPQDDSLGLQPGSLTGSQVLDALSEITSSSALTQNSLISVLLSQLPTTEDITKFYKLVNMNVKVLFFIDSEALTYELSGPPDRTMNPINQIAALTGGHFIVSNQNDINPFRSLLSSIYTSGPGQTLLLSKNIQPLKSIFVGSIDLTNSKENTNITVTLSTVVTGNGSSTTQPMMPIQIYFSLDNSNVSSSVTLTQQGKSNFYSAATTLSAGKMYQVKVILTPKPSLLRIWTTNTIDNDVQITYKDFHDQPKEDGPDDYTGASLSVILQDTTNSNKMSLSISDCSGLAISLYDVFQTFDLSSSGSVNFVPFFCSKPVDASSCMNGTENLYFAQITTDGGFVVSKSFMCPPNSAQTADGCDHTDFRGNFLCGGTSSPYTRGRAGKLIDCSDPYQSNLKYDPSIPARSGLAPFACQCPGEGASCEQAKCSSPNENGGAIDAYYRTYTVILVLNKDDKDGFLTFDDSKFLNINAGNIWQYQLFVVCQYGDVIPIYIGSDAGSFNKSFTYQKGICNITQNGNDNFDVTSILRGTFSSIGRQQRGLTVIYHELSDSSGQELAVSDLEEFLELTQQYKQQVYVFNGFEEKPNSVSDALKNGIMSTGGSILFFDIDGDDIIGQISMFKTMLGAENSLNAHSPVYNGPINILNDDGGYLIIGSLTKGLPSLSSLCGTKTIFHNDFAVVCNVSGTSIQLSNLPPTAWYSFVSQKNAPLAAIITEKTDDQPTAFAVNYTTGGPTMAIALPKGYSVTSNDDNGARLAKRQQCTYVETTANIFQRLPVGYTSITLQMTSGTGARVTKVFPFGVTANPKCQNGGSLNLPNPLCSCPKYWEGPDCSRPKCQNGGVLSTWSNACNCRKTGKGGQFCEQDPTPNS